MPSDICQPVPVSRTIKAPADKLFDIITDPANHPVMDGSGMVREWAEGTASGVGDVFVMKMHRDDMGDYEMANHVIEYERGRRIVWEPVPHNAPNPEEVEPGKYRWGYELTPLDDGSTLVTETFDCSRSPQWLREATNQGAGWIDAMTATLEKLDTLSRP
jgi:uncharacterized protein YndB with AHSA1/START domain